MNETINVYLADDHKVLIDGLLAVLKTNALFEVKGYALNGNNLYQTVTENFVDILVMDINMPEKDGIQVLQEFHEKGYPCKVIILSSFDDAKLIKEVIKLGASGYLTKQCAGENIIDALITVANGKQYYSSIVKERIFDSFTNQNVTEEIITDVNVEEIIKNITDRELEVLNLISQEKSGKYISETLYISPNTVETHRKNLMKKINVKSSIGLVIFAAKYNLLTE